MKTFLNAILAATLTAPLAALAIDLSPTLPGSYGTGGGADAVFVKIDDNWLGSTVLWNEATHSYGSGEAISNFGWGTGVWGVADWHALIDAPAGDSPVIARWAGIASQVNFGNAIYNSMHSSQWGTTLTMPLETLQTNWLARFDGYIRITEKGLYNFSVLYDDGFFFDLYGAEGEKLSLVQDGVNPRDRLGFENDMLLDVGLYRFQLGAYNRLEAGVIDLRWSREGTTDWTLVPTENLLSLTQPVPEPATWGMLLCGLGLIGIAARRRT